MKKLAILGASAALAALPVVGVFAADTTQTDTIKVTVEPACSLTTDSAGSEKTVTIANGTNNPNVEGSTFTIHCNDSKGWYLNAKGAGGDEGNSNKLVGETTKQEINSAAALTGSAWAFKVEASGGTAQGSYGDDWNVVPASDEKIVQGNSTTNTATVKAIYGVAISDTQAADTYTGKVTYTLGHPATE